MIYTPSEASSHISGQAVSSVINNSDVGTRATNLLASTYIRRLPCGARVSTTARARRMHASCCASITVVLDRDRSGSLTSV